MTQRHLVRDLMTVGVFTCTPDATVAEIARLLLEHDLEGVIVLDHEGHAVGKVTQRELVSAFQHETPRTLTAAAIMSEDVPELPPDIPLAAAAGLMRDKGWRVIFLMHNATGISYPAAQLSYRHFLRHLAARSDAELADLGIRAARQSPMQLYAQKRDAARRRRLGATASEPARKECL